MPSKGGQSRGRTGSSTPGEAPKSQPKNAVTQIQRKERADNRERARKAQLKAEANRKETSKEMARLRAQLSQKERQLEEESKKRQPEEDLQGQIEELRERVKRYERVPFLRDLHPKMVEWAASPVNYFSDPNNTSAPGLIRHSWESLESKIIFMAHSYFPFPAPWGSIPPALREKLARLTPKAQEYIEAKDCIAVTLYQAWIWRILADTLFPGDGAAAGPPAGGLSEHWAAYTYLHRLAAPHLTGSGEDTSWVVRFRIWRNLTVGILRHVTGDKTRVSPEFVAKALKDELEPFFCADHRATREEMHRDIECLAEDAAMLDTCIHLDRGDWTVTSRHPDTGGLYGFPIEVPRRPDRFQMVPEGTLQWQATPLAMAGRNVNLIVSPQLRGRAVYYGSMTREAILQESNLDLNESWPMKVMVDESAPSTPGEDDGGATVGQEA